MVLNGMLEIRAQLRSGDALAQALPNFVFFFQAEDGIRAFHVTGVQTCALPISRPPAVARSLSTSRPFRWIRDSRSRGREIGRASCREKCRSRWSPYH